MSTKKGYSQLDLLKGLYEEENRETAFIEASFKLFTDMIFIRDQTIRSDTKEKDELTKMVNYTLYSMAVFLFEISRQNIKYRSWDREKFLRQTVEDKDDFGAWVFISEDEVKEYFRNLESRIRVHFLIYKDISNRNPEVFRNVKKYLRQANNILHNEI